MSDALDGREVVAYRRLVAGLADVEDDDKWSEMNPFERVDAAVSRVENLEEENRELRKKVANLESVSNPDPQSKEYNEMSRDERVRRIREALLKRAEKSYSGKAKMDYKDVLLLFDNHPSAGYAYKLMQLAAEEEGYNYATDGEKRIRVISDAVKDESLFHSVNKDVQAEAA